MGVFDSLFGKKNLDSKKEVESVPWIPLVSVEQLPEIEKNSHTRLQVIFKHSTTCGISRMVLNMFKQNYHFSANEMNLYFLDLHRNREVSNEVGYKFQVMHQSPQLLVIKDGVVVAHDSHGAITDIDLGKYL